MCDIGSHFQHHVLPRLLAKSLLRISYQVLAACWVACATSSSLTGVPPRPKISFTLYLGIFTLYYGILNGYMPLSQRFAPGCGFRLSVFITLSLVCRVGFYLPADVKPLV